MNMEDKRTITMTGYATVTDVADTTVVKVSLKGVKPTYNEAAMELTDNIEKLKQCIIDAGLEKDSLKTSRFEIHQNQKRVKINGDTEYVNDGFAYSTNASFEFPNDFKKLTASIDNIMKLDITPTVNFGFRNSDPGRMRHAALEQATRDAMNKANTIVGAAGCVLGRLINVGDNEGYRPSYRNIDNSDFLMDANVNFSIMPRIDIVPEDDSRTETVTLTWEIEG